MATAMKASTATESGTAAGLSPCPTARHYEGKFEENKPHGWGIYTQGDGNVHKGNWNRGCLWEGDGRWAVLYTTKKACGFDVKTSLMEVSLARSTYGNEANDWKVPPTTDLHTGPMHAKTPTKHALANTIATKALHELIIESLPPLVLIDVLGDEDHPTLPGALMLKGAGSAGAGEGNIDGRLYAVLNQVTAGDEARALVFFCRGAMCWLSYNAAIRAVALGYENVYWYRGGITAWEAAGTTHREDCQNPVVSTRWGLFYVGHTDAKGAGEYNDALSQRRAAAVVSYIVGNFAVDGALVSSKGMGERQLLDKDNPEAAVNRRVEIRNVTQTR